MTLEEDLQKALKVESVANKELATSQQRVVKGESLGDPIKDYLFVCYGTTDFPPVEGKLRKLSELVRVHNGQQVVVLYTKNEVLDEGSCFGGGFSRLEIVGEQLGVLNGDLKFNLEKGEAVLPTDKYVQKGEEPFIFEVGRCLWKLKEEGITISGYHFETSGFFGEKLPKREILFGDEVELYFSTGKTYFEQYLETRSQEWKKDLLAENHFANKEYLTALNLLGVEATARFQEKYDTQVRRRREEVLNGIRSQKSVSYYLDQALGLGLHKEQCEIQLEPGITMNVPKYIKAQCGKYGKKVPE